MCITPIFNCSCMILDLLLVLEAAGGRHWSILSKTIKLFLRNITNTHKLVFILFGADHDNNSSFTRLLSELVFNKMAIEVLFMNLLIYLLGWFSWLGIMYCIKSDIHVEMHLKIYIYNMYAQIVYRMRNICWRQIPFYSLISKWLI